MAPAHEHTKHKRVQDNGVDRQEDSGRPAHHAWEISRDGFERLASITMKWQPYLAQRYADPHDQLTLLNKIIAHAYSGSPFNARSYLAQSDMARMDHIEHATL